MRYWSPVHLCILSFSNLDETTILCVVIRLLVNYRLMDQWIVLDFEKFLALNVQQIISAELIISYT